MGSVRRKRSQPFCSSTAASENRHMNGTMALMAAEVPTPPIT